MSEDDLDTSRDEADDSRQLPLDLGSAYAPQTEGPIELLDDESEQVEDEPEYLEDPEEAGESEDAEEAGESEDAEEAGEPEDAEEAGEPEDAEEEAAEEPEDAEEGATEEPEVEPELEEEAEDEPEPPAERSKPRGFYLTPRQTFTWIAAVLTVLLIGLLVYLLWLLRPADFTKEGGEKQAGLVPVLAIYGPGSGQLPAFNQPMGVDWSPDGKRIYVADARNNRICVFDSMGKPVREFGSLGVAKPLEGAARTWEPGKLSYPVDVAVDGDGLVFVADFYNDSISVFNDKGKFVRRFPDPYKPTGKGSSGNDGGGIAVTSVAVMGDRVYATDTYQIFIFTKKGKLVRQFGMPGSGPEGLDHPGGIAVDREGTIYVSDSNHNRVVAYSPEGRPLWLAGRPVQGLKNETENPFVLPRGLTVMPDGSLLVADPLAQQLVGVDAQGRIIAHYGVRGTTEGQLNFPMDVAASGDLILIADRQNERAQVVRLSNR